MTVVIDNEFVSHNPNEPPSEVNTVVSGIEASVQRPLISPQHDNDDDDLQFFQKDEIPHEHETLRNHPFFWSAVGVVQTFCTAIMFGWASLVPVLRDEGLSYSPTDLSIIFTAGAVGNYLATLPFGFLLDWYGPKTTGIVASVLYGLGLLLCSYDTHFDCFVLGFGLVGLARPGIQMPTLHLANLWKGSGGAVYMSAQAAAFDAGTAVFALFHFFYYKFKIPSGTMFLIYLVVPLWTLLTAIFVWPHETIVKEHYKDNENDDDSDYDEDSQVGAIGSPYFSPKDRKSLAMSERRKLLQQSRSIQLKSQVNAPLNVVLTHVSFYALATWVRVPLEYDCCTFLFHRTHFFLLFLAGRHSHLQAELHCCHHQ
jgi:MFS family permease